MTTEITKWGSLTVALALCLGGAPAALADGPAYKAKSLKDAPVEEPKREWELTANFGVTSDYIFRGFSQSRERPAVQGGVDLTYKIFYAGFWASGIDFGDKPTGGAVAVAEVDFYAGIKPKFGKLTMDLGVIYYTYPGAFDPGAELDYVELKLGGSLEVWKGGTVGLTGFYSPEYTGKTGEVFTLEGVIAQELPKIGMVTPTVSALLGYQVGNTAAYRAIFGAGDDSYLYWNAGMTLAFHERFSIDFRYWDTDLPGGFCGVRLFACDERFVATAKVTF